MNPIIGQGFSEYSIHMHVSYLVLTTVLMIPILQKIKLRLRVLS